MPNLQMSSPDFLQQVRSRVLSLTPLEARLLAKSLMPKSNRFLAHNTPTAKQTVFLLLNDVLEVLFGGAAGGGKSEALLRSAAEFVDVPGYKAILFRRTFRDLALPGALMSRSHEWWDKTEAHWDGQNYTWRFPSGATISFGYLEHDGHELRYQSAEFQFIGFDELTQFPRHQYTYLFSRLRRLKGVDIPLRMRSATNPGGPGHIWVKDRWQLPQGPPPGTNRAFVPATLEDNPYLDQVEYEQSLANLSALTFQQLRLGDWSAAATGGKFDPSDFQIVPYSQVPQASEFSAIVRYWDLASTAVTDMNPDPDWTVGLKIGKTRYGATYLAEPDYYVFDVRRDRRDPGGVEEFMRSVAGLDGLRISQWIEQERGSSGKLLIRNIREHVLKGHQVRGLWITGDKMERASLPAARAREGRVYLVEGDWVSSFLDEASLFGIEGEAQIHDDQIDAFSGGMIALDKEEVMGTSWKVRRH